MLLCLEFFQIRFCLTGLQKRDTHATPVGYLCEEHEQAMRIIIT